MSRVPLIVLASVAMAAFPAAAAAQDNSAIDEYLETVPTPGGGHPGDHPGDGSGGGGGGGSTGAGGGGSQGGQPLSPSNAAALESQGPAGAAAASLAQATAPSQSSQPRNGAGGHSGDSATGVSGGESGDRGSGSGSGLSDVIGAVVGGSDSGGLGPWLPILLVITLLAAIALGVVRRRTGPAVRRGSGPGEASQA